MVMKHGSYFEPTIVMLIMIRLLEVVMTCHAWRGKHEKTFFMFGIGPNIA